MQQNLVTLTTDALVDKSKKKRSKSGCFTCRLKRKKCDEVHPKCGTCKKRMLNCVWPQSGRGRLTQEMRSRLKEKVDFYDEFATKNESFSISKGPSNVSSSSSSVNKTVKNAAKPSKKPNFFKGILKFDKDKFQRLKTKQVSQIEAVKTQYMFINYTNTSAKEFALLSSDVLAEEVAIDSKMESESELQDSSSSPLFDNMEQDASLVSEEKIIAITRQPAIAAAQVTLYDREQNFINEWSPYFGSTPPPPMHIESTDFFWEKMFDLNFHKPIMSPNFSIIPSILDPTFKEDNLLGTSTNKFNSVSIMPKTALVDEENYGLYGLDEEQTEKIYDQLMESFAHWAFSSDDKFAPAACLISQYQFTEQELLLYYTCVNYFLPAVGPQPTLPQLTTTETFMPLLVKNPIVKDVFLCCGATFLAWCQPTKYSVIVEELYQKSKAGLQREIASNKIKGDETWVFACFQLLCLTDKLHNGHGSSMVDRCVDNLAHSFNIIKRKYLGIRRHGPTPTDRMLTESFMYNYTVSLLVAKDLSKLPSPFSQVLQDLTKLLKSPIFNDCDVKWMNNPVLGSSIDAFEMLAKVSYLSRFPLPLKSSHWICKGKELLEECLYYTPPTLPDEVRNDPEKYEKYRPSLLCGSIISKACYLLLSKILRFNEFNVKDFQIQGVVKYSIQSLRDIEKGSPLLCILLWSLLIIGAFAIDSEDILVIKEYLKSASETIHSYGALKICNLLELIWEKNNIDLLFVRENICQVVI